MGVFESGTAAVGTMRIRSADWGSFRFVLTIPAALVAILLGLSIYTHHELRRIERAALGVSTNAVPSVQHLVDARTALRGLAVAIVSSLESGTGRDNADAAATIQRARNEFTVEMTTYKALPFYRGETEIQSELEPAVAQVDAAVARVQHLMSAGEVALAQTTWTQDGRAAAFRVDDLIVRLIKVNSGEVKTLAESILDAEVRSTVIGFVLDGVTILLAVVAVIFAWRLANANRLLRGRSHALERRAEELDAFAGRVAHDLLNPLGSVSLWLEAASCKLDVSDREDASRLLGRARASLSRTAPLVKGLLEFARSAARPTPDAHTDLVKAVEEAISDARPEAEQAAEELRVEECPALEVACEAPVLASVLSNLIHNAIKFTRSSPVRRIIVRAWSEEDRAHIEVEDTGPGMTEETTRTIFDPFVRGPRSDVPGLGLGLATVRRFTEAHGGKVGVQSAPNRGSVFWIELPVMHHAGQPRPA
jgi:signal transduction histidine kinase